MWERGGMERRGSRKEGMGTAGYRQVVEEGCKALGEAHTSWPFGDGCTGEGDTSQPSKGELPSQGSRYLNI